MSKHVRFGSEPAEQEVSQEIETEASEELDYGDRDHEDREATLQARRRAPQEPGSSRDHEARARPRSVQNSFRPLTKKRAVQNPPIDYETFDYQGFIQQEL